MAKQRNPLGICVLPTPGDKITWEEYKTRYGIDLEKIFMDSGDGYLVFRQSFTKIIAISNGTGHKQNVVPALGFPNRIEVYEESDDSPSQTQLFYINNNGEGLSLVIYGDKHIEGGEI